MPPSFRAALALLLAAAPALASRAFTFTLPTDAPTNDRALLLTAQGLLNRATPTLWLYEPVFATAPMATYWYPPHYLTPVKNISFTAVAGADFCALAAATGLLAPGGAARGVALYDDAALDATRWLAVTASALDALLPATRAMRAALPCLAALPVLADFSSPAALGFATNVGAYEWGRTNLLPRCSSDKLYSAGVSFTDATESVFNGADPAIDIGLDGAVALKMFVFNLSPDTKKYAAHAAEFQALVATLRGPTTVPSVYGWAEPEPSMTLATSLGGGAVMCDAAPNLSFWLNVAARPPTLPYHATAPALERDALYVAFQTNEGDTPKFAAGLMGGAWIDAARGSVPISWGVNPLIADVAPGLLEFYGNTASANDTFFAATAGAGYAYPSKMPRDAFHTYVARAARLTAALTPGWPAHAWEIDIWDTNNQSAIEEYAAAYGDGVGAFSMQPEALAGTNAVLPGGLPLVITPKELWYPQQSTACDEDFYAHALARAAANITTRPAFVLVYGLVPRDSCNKTIFDNAHAVRALGALPDGTPLRLVGMQDWVALARAAAAAAPTADATVALAAAATTDAAASAHVVTDEGGRPAAASHSFTLDGPDVSLVVVVNDGAHGNRTYISEFYLKRAGAVATGNTVFNFSHAPTGDWSDIRLSSTAIAWEGGAAGSTGGVVTLQTPTRLTLAGIALGASTESWAIDVTAGFSWGVERTYTAALNLTCERGPALVFDTEYATGALPTASQIPSFVDAGTTFNSSTGCGFACSMDSGPDAGWSLAVTAKPTQSLFFAPSLLAFESTLACDNVDGGCGMLLAWPDVWKGSVIAWGVVPLSPAGVPGPRAVAAGSGASFTWALAPAAANGAPLVGQACPQGVVPFTFSHPDARLQATTCQVAAAFGMWAGNVVGNSPGTTVCLHEMSVFPLGQGIFSGMTGHTALQQQLDMFASHGVREDGFVFPRWQFNAFSDMPIHDQIGHFLTAFYWHAVNTGNASAITAVWPVLMRVVGYVNSTMLFGENGIATTPAPATGLPGSKAGNWFDIVNFGGDDAITNAYICQGLNATALLAAWIGEAANATTLAAMHARCAAAYNARFWNASVQLYGDWVDAAGNGRSYGYLWQQALATDPLAGIASATRAAAMAGAVTARLDAIRAEYNKTAAELWCAPTNLWPVRPEDTFGNGTVQDQTKYGNYENGACFILLHGMYEALLHHAGLPDAVFDAFNATLASAASTLLWGQHFDWRYSGSFEGFDVLSDTLYVLRAGLHGAFGLRQSLGLLEAVRGAAASGMEGASWSFTHMGQPVRVTVVGGTSVIDYL